MGPVPARGRTPLSVRHSKSDDLLKHHANQSPELWFTYHVYHKSPDWIRPTISDHFNIP